MTVTTAGSAESRLTGAANTCHFEHEQEKGEAYFVFDLKTMELVATRGYFQYRGTRRM